MIIVIVFFSSYQWIFWLITNINPTHPFKLVLEPLEDHVSHLFSLEHRRVDISLWKSGRSENSFDLLEKKWPVLM